MSFNSRITAVTPGEPGSQPAVLQMQVCVYVCACVCSKPNRGMLCQCRPSTSRSCRASGTRPPPPNLTTTCPVLRAPVTPPPPPPPTHQQTHTAWHGQDAQGDTRTVTAGLVVAADGFYSRTKRLVSGSSRGSSGGSGGSSGVSSSTNGSSVKCWSRATARVLGRHILVSVALPAHTRAPNPRAHSFSSTALHPILHICTVLSAPQPAVTRRHVPTLPVGLV